MFLSPEVAIVQHSTGVMQVSWDYFENGITFFTNLIYSAVRFAVGSGETAPFVGHNAFLRWNAVQSVGRHEEDGYIAYWSESHVSEDFDIALRLQITGHVIRLASYHDDGFKEGVSLTIYDELARWEKYAYGCNELVFNPIYTWLWKGPFTPLFRTFLWSDMQMSSKITIIGYISSCQYSLHYTNKKSVLTCSFLRLCTCVWISPDHHELLFSRMDERLSRQVLHGVLEGLPFARRGLLWPRQCVSCDHSLPARRERVMGGSPGKLQVDADVRPVLWWSAIPSQPRSSGAHVQHRHAMGCHCKREGEQQLLQRDAEDLQKLQMDVCCHRPPHWRNDLPGELRT